MRAIRTIQLSIFDFFAKHKLGLFLEALSQELDKHHQLLALRSARREHGFSHQGVPLRPSPGQH